MIPSKLKKGNKIRVISPSRSLALISKGNTKIALDRFKDLDLEVSFSKNAEEKDEFISSKIKSRVNDLHDAFTDKKVKAIFTGNVNHLIF